MTTEWIKISERKPTQGDLTVLVAYHNGTEWVCGMCENSHTLSHIAPSWQYWKPLGSMPTPKGPTQEELDAVMVKMIMEAYNNDKGLTGQRDLINLALSYERSAIRHLIQRHRNGELPGPEVIRMISGRVKL